ncbi:hypothetical protein J6590_059173 [Homalodisca vitripennis]|nr:hypothetical protein J6590_059173 [Homalodisca vitripennis]
MTTDGEGRERVGVLQRGPGGSRGQPTEIRRSVCFQVIVLTDRNKIFPTSQVIGFANAQPVILIMLDIGTIGSLSGPGYKSNSKPHIMNTQKKYSFTGSKDEFDFKITGENRSSGFSAKPEYPPLDTCPVGVKRDAPQIICQAVIHNAWPCGGRCARLNDRETVYPGCECGESTAMQLTLHSTLTGPPSPATHTVCHCRCLHFFLVDHAITWWSTTQDKILFQYQDNIATPSYNYEGWRRKEDRQSSQGGSDRHQNGKMIVTCFSNKTTLSKHPTTMKDGDARRIDNRVKVAAIDIRTAR